MATPTPTFRLYTYVDGLGCTVYRVKERGALGIWHWVRYSHAHDRQVYLLERLMGLEQDPVWSWKDRRAVVADLTRMVDRRIAKEAYAKRTAMVSRLKLVIVEDLVIQPTPP